MAKKKHLSALVSFLFLFSIFAGSSLAHRLVPAMYTFGDSLADVGNNNHLNLSSLRANYPHNGIDFPTKKPTGRFCNGKLAVDLLSEKVGLPYSPPYRSIASNLSKNYEKLISGVNFASGASGIMDETSQQFEIISLRKQVDNFILVNDALTDYLGLSHTYYHFTKSLFLIETGSNDIFGYVGTDDLRNKYTPAQYVNSMSNTLKEQFKRLYNLGARKFVIIGVGVIGCIPYLRKDIKGEACVEILNQWSINYNEVLKKMLRNLKFELKAIKYSYFDAFPVLQYVLTNPASYGFVDVKSACCGVGKLKSEGQCSPSATYCSNRTTHFFWDSTHPTEAAHKIFVDYLFDGPLKHTFPLNVKKLIVA